MCDLSIIIVSYNTRHLLRDCLASTPAGCTGQSVKTIVVDNGSSDGSGEMVEREFPSVELIVVEGNLGFAGANNVALERSSGRYVVLLNPDTRVLPGALTAMMRFMDATPGCGYCGPRLLNGDGTHQPSARRFPTVFSGGFAMLSLSRRFPASRHGLDLHALHGDRGVFLADWLTGACLMVRSESADAAGRLDDGFFMYFEETDWCQRMQAAGWEGWYFGGAEVVHLGGRSVSDGSDIGPFSGDHPVHWVNSSRRYARRYYGVAGMWLSEMIKVILFTLIWLRHSVRSCECSGRKMRNAATALRHLLSLRRGQSRRNVESQA